MVYHQNDYRIKILTGCGEEEHRLQDVELMYIISGYVSLHVMDWSY